MEMGFSWDGTVELKFNPRHVI